MKTNGIRGTLAGAFAAAILVAVGIVAASAQGHAGHAQKADMSHDLHYIDMTIMHHEQGVEMARLAQERGADARVKAFAKKTADDQQRDIAVLRGHRQHWYSDRQQMDHSQMTAHMQSMPGHRNMKMDPEADMAKLCAAEGRAFDRLFLDTMDAPPRDGGRHVEGGGEQSRARGDQGSRAQDGRQAAGGDRGDEPHQGFARRRAAGGENGGAQAGGEEAGG